MWITLFKFLLLWEYSEHITGLFMHWHRSQLHHQYNSCWLSLLMTLIVSQVHGTCSLMPGKWKQDSLRLSLMLFLWESLPPSSWTLLLGWELTMNYASRAAILASALVSFEAYLMPSFSCYFLTCIYYSFIMEFQTALGYFLHYTFPMMAATFLNFPFWWP